MQLVNSSFLRCPWYVPQYHAFLLKNLVFKSEKSINILNSLTYGALIDFKNGPVLQTCKYRPVKR